MDTTQVSMSILDMNWYMWILYFIAACVGAIASSLVVNKGNLIIPHIEQLPDDLVNQQYKTSNTSNDAQTPDSAKNKNKQFFEKAQDMGFCGDIIVGMTAAIAILWTMNPQSIFQLIGIGAVAGYGGSTILQTLVTKITADTSKKENERLAAANSTQNQKLQELADTQVKLNETSTEKFIVEKLLEIKK